MSAERRASMEQLAGVTESLRDMVREHTVDTVAIAQLNASTALVMAVQELTDVLRPEVIDAEIHEPTNQIGWIDSRVPLDSVEPWRRIHTHTPDEQKRHVDCVPVWVDA